MQQEPSKNHQEPGGSRTPTREAPPSDTPAAAPPPCDPSWRSQIPYRILQGEDRAEYDLLDRTVDHDQLRAAVAAIVTRGDRPWARLIRAELARHHAQQADAQPTAPALPDADAIARERAREAAAAQQARERLHADWRALVARLHRCDEPTQHRVLRAAGTHAERAVVAGTSRPNPFAVPALRKALDQHAPETATIDPDHAELVDTSRAIGGEGDHP